MKPIWQSVGFWMGGVVLVFLLWVWGDSMRWTTEINRSSSGSLRGLQSLFGFLYIDKLKMEEDRYPLPSAVWNYRRENIDSRDEWFVEKRSSISGWFPSFYIGGWPHGSPPNETGYIINVPYWALVACHLLFWWGGILVFRQYQRKRLVAKGS